MATIQPTFSKVDDHTVKFVYASMLTTDDGGPILGNWSTYTDRNVHVEGPPGAGGAIAIQGSNNGGANWRTLNDNFAVALSISTQSVRQVNEVTEMMRPAVTGGDGTTNMTVSIILHRPPSK